MRKIYKDKDIVKAYTKDGLTYTDIRKKYDCSYKKFRRILKKSGVDFSPSYMLKDLTGQKFSELIVIKRSESIKIKTETSKETQYRTMYLCRCICGKEKDIKRESLINGWVKSCGCIKETPKYQGINELSGTYISRVIWNARHRKIEYNVEKEYLWSIFIKQNGKCALSGRDISFCRDFYIGRYAQTASLDRIDSSKGYVKGNLQWVHRDFNKMKMNTSQKNFIKMCKEVANNFP